jgi:hypothetical protein
MLIRDYNKTIDHSKHRGRLLIEVETDCLADYGVFSGRDSGFGEEQLKKQPVVSYDCGYETFEISGLTIPPKKQIWQYHFAVISREGNVYLNCPQTRILVVSLSPTGSWFNYSGVTTVCSNASLKALRGRPC